MALTIEEAKKLNAGQKLVYLGAYEVEYVRHTAYPRTDGPGAGHVRVTAVRAPLLHMELKVGVEVLAAPSELAWP